MPDFERLLRKLAIEQAAPDQRKIITAEHRGEDRARRQIAIAAVILAALVVSVLLL